MKIVKYLIITITLSLFTIVLALLGFYFFVDVNTLLKAFLENVRSSYHLEFQFKSIDKSILSLLEGIKLKDFYIYEVKNKKRILISKCDYVYISFNLISLILGKQKEIHIHIDKAQIFYDRINEYISNNLHKFKNFESSENAFILGSAIVKNSEIFFGDMSFKFDLEANLINTYLKGFIRDTHSRFVLSRETLKVDNITLKKFGLDVNIRNIHANINLSNQLDIEGTLDFEHDLVSLKGVKFLVKATEKIITFKISPLDNVQIEGNVSKKIDLFLTFENFSIKSFGKEITELLVNSGINNILLSGEIDFTYHKELSLDNGKLNGRIETFSLLPFVIKIKNNKISLEVSFKDSLSDANVSFEILFSSNRLTLSSINFNSGTFDLKSLEKLSFRKNQIESKEVKIKDTNNFVLISNTTIQGNIRKLLVETFGDIIENIYIEGNLDLVESILRGNFSIRFNIFSYPFSMYALFYSSTNISLRLYQSEYPVYLKELYSGITKKFNLSGEINGSMIIKNMDIYLLPNLSGVIDIDFSNTELIDLPIQDSVTKLLNVNLKHLILDKSKIYANISNDSAYGNGMIKGDIETEFTFITSLSGKKNNIKFSYLNVGGDIIKDLPKIFLLGNEINGIKYSYKDNILHFSSFEVTW